MARMRFRSKPRPPSLYAGIGTDDRQPEHLGDCPTVPAEPGGGKWTFTSYPYVDVTREEDPADG